MEIKLDILLYTRQIETRRKNYLSVVDDWNLSKSNGVLIRNLIFSLNEMRYVNKQIKTQISGNVCEFLCALDLSNSYTPRNTLNNR